MSTGGGGGNNYESKSHTSEVSTGSSLGGIFLDFRVGRDVKYASAASIGQETVQATT